MIPTDDDITEHLLRILPTAEAELLYLEARCSDWATAVGIFELKCADLPDGSPLNSAITGRKCRTDWRTHITVKSGSAWEELSLLRLQTDGAGGTNPFNEIDDRTLTAECASAPYRR